MAFRTRQNWRHGFFFLERWSLSVCLCIFLSVCLSVCLSVQTAYVADLVTESNYSFNLDSSEFFHAWYKSKLADITTYRDQSYTSKFTGTKARVQSVWWFHAELPQHQGIKRNIFFLHFLFDFRTALSKIAQMRQDYLNFAKLRSKDCNPCT